VKIFESFEFILVAMIIELKMFTTLARYFEVMLQKKQIEIKVYE
jgi:hypothetical protein